MFKKIDIRGRHFATAGASALIFAAGAAAQGTNGNTTNNGNATNNATLQAQPAQNGGQGGATANGGQQLVGVSALVDNPSAYLGQNVTTAGVVDKILGPRTFTLKGEDALQRNAGQNEIVVVLTGPLPDVPGRGDANRLRPGDPVQITGSFQNYKRIHGDGTGGSASAVGYQGVPMVAASQISIAGISNGASGTNGGGKGGNGAGGGNGGSGNGASGASLSSSPNGGSNGSNGSNGSTASTGSNGSSNGGGRIALSQLIDNPTRYLGRKVTVAGVVGKIEGPRTFTVYGEDAIQHGRSGPNRLRVILATPIPDVPGRPDDARLQPGDPIQLTGTYENLRTLTGGAKGSNVGYQGAPTLVATQLGIAALQNHADLGVGPRQ